MKTKMMEQLEMGVKFNIGIRKIIVDFTIGFIFIKWGMKMRKVEHQKQQEDEQKHQQTKN